MRDLSIQIRRAVARWLFVELRAHYVAEEYGIGARTADAIGLWLEREQSRGVYRDVQEEAFGRVFTTSRRVATKTKVLSAEVRIIEVKVSRDDFLGGLRKGQISNVDAGLGNFADYCYLAVPKDVAVLRLDQLPRGWGLLVVDVSHRSPKYAIDLQLRPERLSPTHPLSDSADDLAHRLSQSSMWRLYEYGRPFPDELDAIVETQEKA